MGTLPLYPVISCALARGNQEFGLKVVSGIRSLLMGGGWQEWGPLVSDVEVSTIPPLGSGEVCV